MIDLSHIITSDDMQWPDDPSTKVERWNTDGTYHLNRLSIGEHSTTHIGAPSHFGFDGTIDAFPIELMTGNLLVCRLENSRHSIITGCDIKDAIALYRSSLKGGRELNMILLSTGWAKYWNSHLYHAGNSESCVPGLSLEALHEIFENTQCKIIGIDGPNIDYGGSAMPRMECNRELARRGYYHVENVGMVPEGITGIYRYILTPLRILGGTGSPCRFLIKKAEV